MQSMWMVSRWIWIEGIFNSAAGRTITTGSPGLICGNPIPGENLSECDQEGMAPYNHGIDASRVTWASDTGETRPSLTAISRCTG